MRRDVVADVLAAGRGALLPLVLESKGPGLLPERVVHDGSPVARVPVLEAHVHRAAERLRAAQTEVAALVAAECCKYLVERQIRRPWTGVAPERRRVAHNASFLLLGAPMLLLPCVQLRLAVGHFAVLLRSRLLASCGEPGRAALRDALLRGFRAPLGRLLLRPGST